MVFENMQRRSLGTVIGGGWSGLWQKAKTGAHSAAVENRLVQAFVAKKWSLLLIVMGFLTRSCDDSGTVITVCACVHCGHLFYKEEIFYIG